MNKKNVIGSYRTKGGGMLVVTPKVRTHLKAHPEITYKLLREAAGKIVLPGRGKFLYKALRFKRFIGYSGSVATRPIAPGAETTFASRINRKDPIRVMEAKKEKIKTMIVIAAPMGKKKDTYKLITAYVGARAAKAPGDSTISSSMELRNSLRFWCRHAMIYDPKVMGKPFVSSWKIIIKKK